MGPDDWYHPDDTIAQWVRLAAAGTAKSAALTDAWLARILSAITGRTVDPIGATLPAAPRGVDPAQVYARPAEQYRYARSQGAGEAEATTVAERRLRLIAGDDLALAERETTRQAYRAAKATGYRRIVHPERSRGGTCGLCLAASDQVYRTDELLPIHDRCQCTTLPIIGKRDPGRELNADEFRDLYGRAGGTSGAELKRVRYQVHAHGELGPVLRAEGDQFTDEAAAAARAA